MEEHPQSGPIVTQVSGNLDETFFRRAGNDKEYLLTDAIGNVRGLTDSNGQVNTQYKYDVFGNSQQSGQPSTTGNTLQFTGRENDGTGLYYFRNRYYSPELRRFISRDPLGEAAGENEYAYVKNDPIGFIDPMGTDGCQPLRSGRCPGPPKEPEGPGEPPRRPPVFISDPPKPSGTPDVPVAPGTPPPPPRTCTGHSQWPCMPTLPGTLQLGGSASIIGGILAGVGGVGMAVDGSGNVVPYTEYGGGAGAGGNGAVGFSVTSTTAKTVEDLTGKFYTGSVGAGEGLDASVHGTFGLSEHGPVIGTGIFFGAGAGAGGSVVVTNTHLWDPWKFNIWDELGIRRCN